MQVFTDDGTRIDVAIDGSGRDAIVLLSGFALSKSLWDEQVAALAKTHRVVRPDLRGMGTSPAPSGPYLMETLAADVAAVLDACGIERATLAGHSLGGYVSLAFARMFTERVERLALVCSRIQADSPEAVRERYELADRIESGDSMQPYVDACLERLVSPQTLSEKPKVVHRIRQMLAATHPVGAAEMLRGVAERVASDDIASDLAMPVLVIAGSDDPFNSQDQMAETVAAFGNAQLRTCANSSHVPMVENPGCVTAALLELLGWPSE